MVYDNNGNIIKQREFAFTLKDNTKVNVFYFSLRYNMFKRIYKTLTGVQRFLFFSMGLIVLILFLYGAIYLYNDDKSTLIYCAVSGVNVIPCCIWAMLISFWKNDYIFQDGELINKYGLFRKKIVKTKVQDIPYMVITKSSNWRGGDLKDKKGRFVLSMALVTEYKLFCSKGFFHDFSLSKYYEKEELLFLGLYDDYFLKVIEAGFVGEIYVLEKLYDALLKEWEPLIASGQLNVENIKPMKTRL